MRGAVARELVHKTRGHESWRYVCDHCRETQEWFRIPPCWTLVLNEGAAHSEPGFEYHLCQPACLSAWFVVNVLEQAT